MKKAAGFNLVELMVALAMSAAIIAVMTSSFASLNSNFMYSNNLLELHQKLRLALRIIERDAQNAGTFGNFSFHNQLASSVYESASTANNCSGNNDWCKFDNTAASGMGVGVRSYSALPANVATGATIATGSNVLRVQYGSSDVSALDFANSCPPGPTSPPYSYAGGQFTCLHFTPNILSTAQIYMLSSSNKAYLLNFSDTVAVNSLTTSATIGVNESSVESGVLHTPDVYSMALVNFNTSYYFVATINNVTGLYIVKMSNDKTLTSPKLISSYVTNMKISYLVLRSDAEHLNNYDSVAANSNAISYNWCSAAAMSTAGSACFNQWQRIVSMSIELTGQNTTGGNNASQTESQTVGWLW